MKILCIDVGNTSVHWAIVENFSILENGSFLNSKDEYLSLCKKDFEKVCFCSVVPSVSEKIKHFFKDKNLQELNCESAKIKISYPCPKQIGADRLSDAIAAKHFYGENCIVIDMGTAVTFEVITQQNGYEGGVICSGISSMSDYLHNQTALLPKLDPNNLDTQSVIGKTTLDAMKIGCRLGFTAMISSITNEISNDLHSRGILKEDIKIIMTGSTAYSFKKYLPSFICDLNLTLLGLYINFKD